MVANYNFIRGTVSRETKWNLKYIEPVDLLRFRNSPCRPTNDYEVKSGEKHPEITVIRSLWPFLYSASSRLLLRIPRKPKCSQEAMHIHQYYLILFNCKSLDPLIRELHFVSADFVVCFLSWVKIQLDMHGRLHILIPCITFVKYNFHPKVVPGMEWQKDAGPMFIG